MTPCGVGDVVVFGGGIVPKLGKYFAGSPFRASFETKGRFSRYVSTVPTYMIRAETPALRGLATLFQDEK